ncbi:MAG: GNAT family N-acetyltransferase, partial [Caldilineaceae bacterium]|nr:GNAT family N-acetyltransferase [Caldilineaceae bacterium]
MNANALLSTEVGDGLILRAVTSLADVQRYIDLNARVTNEGDIAQRLLHHHPTTTHADYWLVVDEATGKAVSTTCLLPWRCRLDGIALHVAMLEMVVTDPAYRKRGLVRAQIEHFHRVVAERGFDLCIIQGIPYYYRQFGYAYAIDHTPLTRLAAWQIPAVSSEERARYRWRPATVDDVATLAHFYAATMTQHHLFVERSATEWRYLLQHKGHPVRLFEEVQSTHVFGYIVPTRAQSPFRLY